MLAPTHVSLTTRFEGLADWLERHSRIALVVFSLVFLGVTCFLGATKLMQFDEIFTYYPARQATIGEVWSFFAEGLDVHTPILALMAHASLKVFGDNHLALRLPVILGYWLLCVSIYAFVSYRCSKVYGMAAMLLPPVTSVYFYATEIRPYGALLGVSAFALVCWQRVTSESRRMAWLAALFVALTLCVSLHYFAVFLWIPLGVAGLVRDWRRRKVDWPLWIVLVASLFPLVVFFPMIQTARVNFLSGIWSPPSLGDIENAYRFMLTLAFAPLLGTVIVWLVLSEERPAEQKSELTRPLAPLPERVLIALVALTPAYVVPIMLLGGTFVPRYVLFTLTGLTILLAEAAYRRARGNAFFAVVAVVCLGGWFLLKYPNVGRHQMAESRGLPFRQAQPLENKSWMQAIEKQSGLPVVINPAVFFLHFQHYSLPEVRERTFYLTSLADAMKYDGADTGDRNLQFFHRRFPVQVAAYDEFVSTHREFLVCAETTNPTWVLEKLVDDGAKLQLVLRDGTYFLYHAQLP
jgi:Dolichyl-phosphate-mannose-protein mannosyltransferase